jgi:hypothetical protein
MVNNVIALDEKEEAIALEFNFDNFSADDFEELNDALRAVKIKAAAEIYAKIVKKCPKSWGSPSDPMTYRKLNYKRDFRHLVTHMSEALQEDSKK